MIDDINPDQRRAAQNFQQQQEFERQMLVNLETTSRTRKGISDTSSSADKPKLISEGNELANRADQNFRRALQMAWEHRQDNLTSPEEARQFIERLAATVSEGLLQQGQGLWRTWETKFKQTPVAEIPKALKEFYQEFCQRLQTQADPVTTAAWVEQRFDSQIHALADGSGRTTKLLSALVLVRNNHPLPHYRNRDEYYQNIEKAFPEWEQYYRSLFAEQGESKVNEQKYQHMLELIQHYHAGQMREGGVMPYWPHCERAAQLLREVLEQTGEATPRQKEVMVLSDLGHDLYEDTKVTREEIRQQFGDEVDGLIEEMTNRFGDHDVLPYVQQLLHGSEAARLNKLTDLYDNYNTGASWVSENGAKWTGEFLWPILETQWQALRGSAYQQFPKAAALLEGKIERARKQFMAALEQAMQP